MFGKEYITTLVTFPYLLSLHFSIAITNALNLASLRVREQVLHQYKKSKIIPPCIYTANEGKKYSGMTGRNHPPNFISSFFRPKLNK